jgi:CRISPR type III-B/RAMP module-associated protein Cmr3
MESYDAKERLIESVYVNGQGVLVQEEDIFSSTVRVGITKRHRWRSKTDRREKERGFYKQQVYKLHSDWSFGFLAEFEESFDPLQLDKQIVPFGGERSLFQIQVSETEKSWEELDGSLTAVPFKTSQSLKFILLSDAFVDPEVYDLCSAAVSDTVDFQNIHTPKGKNVRYASLTSNPNEHKNKRYKSGKYNLLARGSVLYAADDQGSKLEEALTAAANFRNIGYNHFIKR